jgi:hypothetical protein
MNVIFLDNDGVICLSNNWGGRFNKQKKWMRLNPDLSDFPVDCKFDNFDTKAIKVLNSILEETGAEIVVSSDWKNNASLEEIGDYYEAQGISKRPIAVTQKFTDISDEMVTEGFKFSFTEELEMERYFEIEKYLKDHKEIEKWRRKQSLLRTLIRRPEIFANKKLSIKELTLIKELEKDLEKD